MASASPDGSNMTENTDSAIRRLLAYCQENDWAGYDPYDALNSKLFDYLPFLKFRWPRIAITQFLKHSPINVRRLALVPKTQSPKAIALFLSGLLNLAKVDATNREDLIDLMIERLIALRSPGASSWCWGYSFPWQTRMILVPAGSANLVCTTFVASALLDSYEQRNDSRCLKLAVSATEYILKELYWTEGDAAGFSYPLPGVRSKTHNANLLASALLCRVCKYTGDVKFLEPALRVARYSAGKQKEDGSWDYGELWSQRWIDNFHTGYNLCALRSIEQYTETSEFASHLRSGFGFYKAHFFREDGGVRYFHDRDYPVDIHCVAQSIITLVALKDLDPANVALARSVFQWAMSNMWDEQGFFYYRMHRLGTIRTSYMRWSQAWMFLAMSVLLCESRAARPHNRAQRLRTLSSAR